MTLESVIHQFRNGATAEQIQEDFPSLKLGDIYSAIAYYLQHSDAVEEYLDQQDTAAAETRKEIESHQDTNAVREKLRRRRLTAVK